MQPIHPSLIETPDMDEHWAARLISKLEPRPRRIVIVGAGPRLLANLLSDDYEVVKVDLEQKELDEAAQYVAMCFPEARPEVKYILGDITDEAQQVVILAEDDVIVLDNSLHHFTNPGLGLNKILDSLPRGTMIILDFTEDLFIRGRTGAETLWASRMQKLEGEAEREILKQAVDQTFEECLTCLRTHGLLAEEDIRKFLSRIGTDPIEFQYLLPCPCDAPRCRQIAWLWCAVIRKGLPLLGLKKCIDDHVVQRDAYFLS